MNTIHGINGPVVTVCGHTGLSMMEMVLVGDAHLVGEVIGITTAKYSTSSSGTNVEGLGFAIPINDVKNIISDLIQYGYVTGKPYMGITGVTMSASVAQQYGVTNAVLGVYVATVEDGSCSAKAGLQPGDIIPAMDEDDVVTFQDLEAAKATHQAGDTVTLRFRVGNVYKNKKIAVYRGDTCIYSRKRPVLAPGEMETVRLKAELLRGPGDAVTVTLEEG